MRVQRREAHSHGILGSDARALACAGLEWENRYMAETQHQEIDGVAKNGPRMQRPAPNGYALPVGRPKGTPNRVTRTIREAVEKAARDCHPQGLAGWLVDRANGGIQDRQIFAAVVNKAMPLQVQASVNGGVKLELSWLGGRQIGATAAQIDGKQPQVIEMQADSDGVLRIKDPVHSAVTPAGAAAEGPQGAKE